MFLGIKRSKFARNRSREQEAGSFFNKTSTGLNSVFSLIVTIFFTPALITSSILSKEILIPFANIFLSLGYLSNFFYRLYKNEMSKAELIISTLTLAALIAGALILFPPAAALSALGIIQFVNQIAVVINIFFMIRHVVVPPMKHLMERVAQRLGFDIAGQYYSKPALTLKHDRYVIDRILMKIYGHDSDSPQFNEQQLINLNKLLHKLTVYISKYDEALFGYIKNQNKIACFEKMIDELTVHGDSDSSYTLIKKKICFKSTKLQLLQKAEEKVKSGLGDATQEDKALSFFYTSLFHKKEHNKEVLQAGLRDLQTEIKRQQAKITSLQECLPLTLARTPSYH